MRYSKDMHLKKDITYNDLVEQLSSDNNYLSTL